MRERHGYKDMIYTVTFNPSLDYVMDLGRFRLGQVNRSEAEGICPGGKGINVSQVLHNLGCGTVALGFFAGFTGEEIGRRLEENGLCTDFIRLGQGTSRINVKLRESKDGESVVSEVNAGGPEIGRQAFGALMAKLEALEAGDVLVLAGSIPGSLPETVYEDICKGLAGRGIRIVVDATGALLSNVLQYRPFLVKPNHHELGELFGVELHTRAEVLPFARRLQGAGAENVLVSMAGEGAVLAASDGRCYEAEAPRGRARYPVGAGDSMVAGFLAGYEETGSYEEAFYMGLCAGSASAFSEGLAVREDVQRLRAGLHR